MYYTVIGLYADNDQRWASGYDVDTPADAIRAAREEVAAAGNELLVAGVIEGKHPTADSGMYGKDDE